MPGRARRAARLGGSAGRAGETPRRRRPALCAALVSLLLAWTLYAPAQGQSVRVYPLADSVTVGERFPLAVAVSHSAQSVLFLDPPADPVEAPLAFGDAEVLALRRLPPRLGEGARVDSAVYEAVVFALDTARVGPVAVQLIAGGDTVEVEGGRALLPVRALVAEGDEPRPLDPPLDFPDAWPWWVWALIVAVPIVLLIVWLLRRRSRPVQPPRSPEEEATHRLDRLAEADPATPEAVEAWFVELSDLLRTYLARQLGVPAHERTTEETTAHLVPEPLVSDAAREALGRALAQADLVKFADARPGSDERTAALRDARNAVDAIEAARRAAAEAAEASRTPEPARGGVG